MDLNKFLDIENYYKQKISQSKKRIRKEEKLLNKARSKYDTLITQAYEDGLFKLSLGKLKEVIANYHNIPIFEINLMLKGSAKLFFSQDLINYRGLISSLKEYPGKVKIWVSFTSQDGNLKVSISSGNVCKFLIENEKLFSTNGYLNDNLQFINGFDENNSLCTTMTFSPKCIKDVVVNIHPTQLDIDENCETLKPALFNYLENELEDREL